MRKDKALGMIERLIVSYKYKKLPDDLSANVREWFFKDIMNDIDLDNLQNYKVNNSDNIPLISKIDRVVIGDYGPLIEFDSINANMDILYIDPKEAHRVSNEMIDNENYIVYTSNGRDKIFLQLKKVEYADVLIGKLYISPYSSIILKKLTST